MAEKTFTYELDGLKFSVLVTEVDGVLTATITVLEGYADFNAVYWGDDVNDGSSATLTGAKDSSLNMNGASYEGEMVDWDGAQKLSSAGLGKEGTDKATALEAGQSFSFQLSGITSLDDIDYLGIRATSTSTPGGSIKAIEQPDPPPPPVTDHFPEWAAPAISHVTFYFDTPDGFAPDTKGVVGEKGANNPDGWFTVKFDVEGTGVSNDLDVWDQDALAAIQAKFPDLDMTTLKGVAIKGGTTETWYDFDNNPNDTDTTPAVFVVENKELDAAGTVAFNGANYEFTIL